MAMRNLSDQLLHELGREIVCGEREPGSTLPKVETLSEMRGVSRTVVREAIKGLHARRLVESSTRTGTAVREPESWLWWDPDVIGWAAGADDNRTVLLQLSEVRMAMEPAAVKLAARNATPEDVEAIRHAFDKLTYALDDETVWAEADGHFHEAILDASHNMLMASLVRTLQYGLVQSRYKTMKALRRQQERDSPGRTAQALEMHRAVMEAVCSGQEDTAHHAMTHLLETVVQLLEEEESR
ncbi:FadR/GntR family transcriptional regulator [Alkalicoccus urumqiensis]|nr:FadR/GntR family transcriptional regulator [Alkalicoccus urumqiensis]